MVNIFAAVQVGNQFQRDSRGILRESGISGNYQARQAAVIMLRTIRTPEWVDDHASGQMST